MQKIKDYVDRFFKTGKINRNYTLMGADMFALMKEMSTKSGDALWDAITTLFCYGYAKGYRAAKAEMKKAV